jgi:hypothetical protein
MLLGGTCTPGYEEMEQALKNKLSTTVLKALDGLIKPLRI